MKRDFGGLAWRTVLTSILTLLSCLAPRLAQAIENQPLSIESRSVVFSYPQTDPYDLHNLYGFNHAPSVARLPDGRLFCVWFSGPFEASLHQVILGSFSLDEGRTWEKAFVVQDKPQSSDFDPALLIDGDRTWLFYVCGRWNRYPFAQDPKPGAEYVGEATGSGLAERKLIGHESFHLYARHSDDSGKTWSEERMIHQSAGCRSNGIRLTSGELLVPAHDFMNKWTESYVLKSTDGGKTWDRKGSIVNESGVDEPTIAELPNSQVLMVLRTGDGRLWTCTSKDGGESWSVPEKQEMLAGATSHNLFRMGDGSVVLTHNECEAGPRTPLTMRVTRDGRTWTEPLAIAESRTPGKGNEFWSCQVTYPSVCEAPGGALVAVWADINMSNREQYGDIRSARIELAK